MHLLASGLRDPVSRNAYKQNHASRNTSPSIIHTSIVRHVVRTVEQRVRHYISRLVGNGHFLESAARVSLVANVKCVLFERGGDPSIIISIDVSGAIQYRGLLHLDLHANANSCHQSNII